MVQTVDFFTPVVDNPYDFGQIAVANSLSDIYTMGAKPVTALNIVCFPSDTFGIPILRDILRGGLDKLTEAGVALVGGHTVKDNELKYGLSVTGLVDPKRLVTNGNSKPGDVLILTKPLGTGILSTALKAGKLSRRYAVQLTKSMATLNKIASELMTKAGVNACTDITGFGFAGHTAQMLENSGVAARIDSHSIPYFRGALRLAGKGYRPGGLERNREYYSSCVTIEKTVSSDFIDLLYDPQTSGGLLISVSRHKAGRLLKKLREAGTAEAAAVGEILAGKPGHMIVT
jgi:selenide,water dikinase